MGKLYLALDVGTSSCKAAAFDEQGHMVAQGRCEYKTKHPRVNWAEQDPIDWTEALTEACQVMSHDLGNRANDLTAGSFSAHGPTLVLMNEGGEALQPAITWQDFRALSQGKKLIDEVPDLGWIGPGPLLCGLPAKLLWVKENWSENFQNCRWVGGSKSYVGHWLTGNLAAEPSSGPGGWEWNEEVFEYIGLPKGKLPGIRGFTQRLGYLKNDVADLCGLPDGIPIYMGLNDGASSVLGSGAVKAGDACVTLSTNGVARLVLEKPLPPETALEMDAFFWPFVSDKWVVGGMTITGGRSLAWLKDCVKAVDFEQLISEASSVPVGSGGVLFLPYLMGRGSPQPDEHMRASFINLDVNTGRGHMARAVLEGVVFSLRDIYRKFEQLGFEVGDTYLTGGGGENETWRGILADVLNQNVILAGGDALLGSAIITAIASGGYKDISTAVANMVSLREKREPIQRNVVQYREVYRKYRYYASVMQDASNSFPD